MLIFYALQPCPKTSSAQVPYFSVCVKSPFSEISAMLRDCQTRRQDSIRADRRKLGSEEDGGWEGGRKEVRQRRSLSVEWQAVGGVGRAYLPYLTCPCGVPYTVPSTDCLEGFTAFHRATHCGMLSAHPVNVMSHPSWRFVTVASV